MINLTVEQQNKLEALCKAMDKMDNYIKLMNMSLYGRICSLRHFNDYKWIGGSVTPEEQENYKREVNILKHKIIIEDSVTQFLVPLQLKISDIHDGALDFYYDNNIIELLQHPERIEGEPPAIINLL